MVCPGVRSGTPPFQNLTHFRCHKGVAAVFVLRIADIQGARFPIHIAPGEFVAFSRAQTAEQGKHGQVVGVRGAFHKRGQKRVHFVHGEKAHPAVVLARLLHLAGGAVAGHDITSGSQSPHLGDDRHHIADGRGGLARFKHLRLDAFHLLHGNDPHRLLAERRRYPAGIQPFFAVHGAGFFGFRGIGQVIRFPKIPEGDARLAQSGLFPVRGFTFVFVGGAQFGEGLRPFAVFPVFAQLGQKGFAVALRNFVRPPAHSLVVYLAVALVLKAPVAIRASAVQAGLVFPVADAFGRRDPFDRHSMLLILSDHAASGSGSDNRKPRFKRSDFVLPLYYLFS